MANIQFSSLSISTQFPQQTWIKVTCAVGFSVYTFWKVTGYLMGYKKQTRLENTIKLRRMERKQDIKKIKEALNTNDENIIKKRHWIVGLSTKEIMEKLQTEELGPVEVLEAFQCSALLAQEKTNCVSQFITEAHDWCLQLEEEYKGRSDKPPLYGLPFSVKESIGVKGYDSTWGLAQFLFDPMQEDGALVIRLRQLGAVPFLLTNIPQTLMSFGCSNPIYGLTTNPADPKRTCGGSTGGEGALLAFRGSAFGLGSDLAGSIRVPSHFSGVTGLKPCSVRLSQSGGRMVILGRTVVVPSFGPMANDVDTLVLFMRNVLQEPFFGMDTYTVPIPFRTDIFNSERKLVIGYYHSDGFLETTPACRRAVHIAKKILEEKGHRLVPFKPPDIDELASIACSVFSMDGGHIVDRLLREDVPDPFVSPCFPQCSFFGITQRLIAKLMVFGGQKKLAMFIDSYDKTTRDMGYTMAKLIQFKSQFNYEWRRLNLDAVVCPACSTVATPHHTLSNMFPAFLHTALYNVLDYPAGIVPVTTVSQADEHEMATGYKTGEYFADLIQQCNREGTVGLPVGVQCVAGPYNEEICLRVMKDVEDGMKAIRS